MLWRGSKGQHVALFIGCLMASTVAAEVHLAVASNFQAPMADITRRFNATTDRALLTTYGASGKFFAQISQGAPFDVFLSADQAKPTALVQSGLAVAESRFTYAVGQLALWSRNPSLISAESDILATQHFNKLAMANPRHAPYGVAAVAVLQNLHLEHTTRSRWITGENVAQAFQFVSTGNADIGFVARSQLHGAHRNQGSTWWVPPTLHPPIRQDAVLLARASENQAAHAFLRFLRSDEIQSVIASYGYASQLTVPGP